MKRRTFIKHCGCSAITISGASLLTACQTNETFLTPTLVNSKNEIIVKRTMFDQQSFVLVEHPHLEYPIAIFKIVEDQFSASLMSCTHQQCTTSVVDDAIVCPCHGARFTHQGKVIKGPAEEDLTSYRTRSTKDDVFILLS